MDRDRVVDLDASFRRVGSALPNEQLHAPLLDKGTKPSPFAIQPAEGRSKPCPTGFNKPAASSHACWQTASLCGDGVHHRRPVINIQVGF